MMAMSKVIIHAPCAYTSACVEYVLNLCAYFHGSAMRVSRVVLWSAYHALNISKLIKILRVCAPACHYLYVLLQKYFLP